MAKKQIPIKSRGLLCQQDIPPDPQVQELENAVETLMNSEFGKLLFALYSETDFVGTYEQRKFVVGAMLQTMLLAQAEQETMV
jgi:hypothetical protein